MKQLIKTNTISLVVFLGLWVLIGCKKEDPEKEGPCGVKDPIMQLPWLKKEVEFYSSNPTYSFAVFSAHYQGERIFWFSNILGKGLEYYNCEGKLKYIGSPRPTDDESQKIIQLMLKYDTACSYIIWSTPLFKQISVCK